MISTEEEAAIFMRYPGHQTHTKKRSEKQPLAAAYHYDCSCGRKLGVTSASVWLASRPRPHATDGELMGRIE